MLLREEHFNSNQEEYKEAVLLRVLGRNRKQANVMGVSVILSRVWAWYFTIDGWKCYAFTPSQFMSNLHTLFFLLMSRKLAHGKISLLSLPPSLFFLPHLWVLSLGGGNVVLPTARSGVNHENRLISTCDGSLPHLTWPHLAELACLPIRVVPSLSGLFLGTQITSFLSPSLSFFDLTATATMSMSFTFDGERPDW